MPNSRDVTKAIVREQFYLLGKILADATGAKDAYRKALADLEKQKAMYSPEGLEEQQGKARRELLAKNQEYASGFAQQLEKLRGALGELHGQLDLSDPALRTALDLIKNVGPGLGTENIQTINAQFAGNQPALRMLQAAYKAAGVSYDGGLVSQIYDLAGAVQDINQAADMALQQGGSLNMLASAVGKVAKAEGYEFETLPDATGFEEVARRGAGLS